MPREYMIDNGLKRFIIRDEPQFNRWMLVSFKDDFVLCYTKYTEDTKELYLDYLCKGYERHARLHVK
jgi:hypothetical protein